MIKENQKRLNRLHILLDALVIFISYLIAYLIMYYNDDAILALSAQVYFSALIIIIPGFLILYEFFELYTPKRISGRRSEIANIFKANSIGFLIFTLTLYLGGKNMNMHHRVKQNPEWGYNIRGILDDHKERGYCYNGVKVIGTIANLHMILEMNVLDEIAITLSIKEYEHLEAIVNDCEKSGVHTKFIPDYNNFIPTIPYIEDLQGLPVINIRHVPLTELHNAYIKRIVDIFGALFGIILFSPVMLITAILVKLTDGGPIIYSQERVGLHNKPFKMYKFRSMAVQKPSEEKSKWTTPNDPRVTAVGRFIRKTSIDETPQFFNVLKGNMSLVGPRPERPFYVEKFREEIPHYMIKHQVRPGLTGWAQVNGFRGDTSIQKRIDHDLYYIENWTLGFDFKIMFLTIFKGFINKNAY